MTLTANTPASEAEDPWEATRPRRLSPSRAGDYMQCPRMYAAKVVEKVPDPPTLAQAVGVLTHQVLEDMFAWEPWDRTIDQAVEHLPTAWEKVTAGDEERGYTPDQIASWGVTSADVLHRAGQRLGTYFALEDPTVYLREAITTELELDGEVAGVPVVGFIDRIDTTVDPATGEILERLNDWKTGKAPAPRFRDRALWQLRFYAWVRWRFTGVLPTKVRLVYLGDRPGIVQETPYPRDIERFETEAVALWADIQRSYDRNAWPTRPSPLCAWCPLFDICPDAQHPKHRKGQQQ